MKLSTALIVATMGIGAVACKSRGYNPNESNTKSTHIPVSSAKRQALGNCWLYATSSWLESFLLMATHGKEYNISESYFLYRIYEMRLKASKQEWPEEIYAGGEWHEVVDLINRFGIMKEGDFIPEEANDALSETQARATEYINDSMRQGLLSKDNSDEAIEHELDEAFHVNRDALEGKIITADQIEISPGHVLREELKHWKEHAFDFEGPPEGAQLPRRAKLTQSAQRLLIEIKDHLNQKHPLLANWWIDFNGLDEHGILSAKTLSKNGGAGAGGAHMTNLVDYVATGKTPQGLPFETDEGAVSKQLQDYALRYGDIKYLVMRNTWGAFRDDRPDYESRDPQQKHTRGFQRLEADYLFSWLPVTRENSDRNGGIPYITGIYSIVLPDYGLSQAAQEAIKKIH